MQIKRISSKPYPSAEENCRCLEKTSDSLWPPSESHMDTLASYLMARENGSQEIARLLKVLQRPYVIVEIGCGCGMLAGEIARKNPEIGMIATDTYDWTIPSQYGSHYRDEALLWREGRLAIQQNCPDNLVSLRADIGLLTYLPDASVDTILLINPEPAVGRAVLKHLTNPAIYQKIRSGEKQLVVLPFSREMGVSSCGGNEFDHDKDWSRGLGFLMDSGFAFCKGSPVLWQVNLAKLSPYSRNSTQNDIYLFGNIQRVNATGKKLSGFPAALKKFMHMLHVTA